ncbi:hypothetical protein K505DRAFT_244158 [Melanomma pulvis-pyrius CBS 109.77]|uniref:F-box domain-containing protein n=1 Tax=Melanomma pulvis-pyrius CBS 109.77 TaxID=1314802 RepID=A0A6A6XCW3_9PLEO|nr:hypothetical protein K505DRAFT_244158 [Melanomma pulvis-pyrius CBS 109.77]
MARTMAPDEYQELGRRYYKQKLYEKAVEAFTDGIEATNTPSLDLFDHRAASYDKLAKFGLAVKDGREMIRTHKENVKGYLRTGSLLEKMNKLETAAGIYKYGMKNVPITDTNFKVLQQLHDRITRKLSPAKAVDPFTVLPVELVEMAVGYLSFKSMVSCIRVSKGWKNFLIKLPNLWTDLDFSGARKPVSKVFIRNAVFRSEYRITRATIHRVMDLQIFVNVATACKGLTSLEFISGGLTSKTFIDIAQCAANLKKLVIHTDITLDTASQILRWRPTLEHVEFRSIFMATETTGWKGPFPNLHSLLINGPDNGRDSNNLSLALPLLIRQTPELQSLTLTRNILVGDLGLSRLPLTNLVLKNVQMELFWQFPRLPSTLRQLTLYPRNQCALPTSLSANGVAAGSWTNAVYSHLPNLTHLSLGSFSDLSPGFFSALLDICMGDPADTPGTPVPESQSENEKVSLSSLQHLSVRHSLPHVDVPNFFGTDGLFTSSPRILSRSLQSLDMATLQCTDDDIETLLTLTNSLQQLDLSLTKITGASVKMLVDGLPDLKFLNLNECTRISSRDAIHYAEKRGVTVSCQMGDLRGVGKRIRYGY